MLVSANQRKLELEEEIGAEDIEFSDGEELADSDQEHGDAVDQLDFDFGDHILSVCQALGGFEEKRVDAKQTRLAYVLGVQGLECLRDLKKFLRHDDATKEKFVLRFLGQQRILQKDLIPILLEYTDHPKVSSAVLDLLVPMTWPVDPTSQFLPEQLDHLLAYKEAFTHQGVFTCILKIIMQALAVEKRQRSERDLANIRFGLTLLRNVLAVPVPVASIKASAEVFIRSTLQESLIAVMHKEHALEFVLTLAGSLDQSEFVEWSMLILEIVYHIVKGRKAVDLAKPPNHSDELRAALLADKARSSTQSINSRHSRFGGSYSFKMADGKMHNSFRQGAAFAPMEQTLNNGKKGRAGGVRKPVNIGNEEQPRSLLSTDARAALVSFLNGMLESAFNLLVIATKRELAAERITITDQDYLRFFTVTSFILAYQLARHEATPNEALGFETVASVVNPQAMAFVIRELRKSEGEKRWTVLQSGLGLFRQIVLSLDAMAHATDEELRQVSEGMQNLLFYEVSTIEFIEHLIKSFKPTTLTTTYLKVLVETVHVLLRSLEKFSKSRPLFVRKEKRVKKSNELQGGVSEDEDERREFEDKRFDFGVLENRFASDTVIATYCILLKDYQTMEPTLLHQVLKMLYRICFNTKHGPMFYKLSTLTLFNRILSGQHRLPKTAEHKELVAFVTAVVRKFFASLSDYPFLFLDLMFVKTKQDCTILRDGLVAVEAIEAKKQPKDAYDSNDELEIKPGFTWSQQVGIAVRLLVDQDQEDILSWLLGKLADAERIFKLADDQPLFQLVTQDDMILRAFAKNQAFRLLLSLLNFEERTVGSSAAEPAEPSAELAEPVGEKEWWLKTAITADNLEDYQELVRNSMLDAGEVEGKPAKKHVRKRKEPKEKLPREKKPKPTTSKAMESNLSKAIISDSDSSDDDAFFQEEAALRERIALRYEEAKAHQEQPKKKPGNPTQSTESTESAAESEVSKVASATTSPVASPIPARRSASNSPKSSPEKPKRRLKRKVVSSDTDES